MKKTTLLILGLLIILLTATSCMQSKKHEWKPIRQKKALIAHVVQWKSEKLSMISQWYTGESKNWELLADANPNINPDKLSIGNKIFIPSRLLKTKKTMPKKFVSNYHKKTKKPAIKKIKKKRKKNPTVIKKPKPDPIDDDFEVIGPK